MRKLKVIGFIAVLGLVFGSSAFAAEFVKPADDGNGTVNLSASETHHNLYTAGGNVIVNSKVTGDLYAAGGMVKIIGEVEDDLTLAGGNIDISGKVGGNLRVAGGNISLSSAVQEDLLAAGGNIFISESAAITGDLVIAGGNLDLQATVGGAAKIAGGTVVINSTINGNVNIIADQKLTFGPKSKILGKIVYRGNSDPVIQEGAQIGTIDRQPMPKHNRFTGGLFGIGIVIGLLAFIAAGLLVMYLLRRELLVATDLMREEPWANLGIGAIALILTPILFVVLLITLIGYYIALILITFYVFALLLSCLVGAVFLGRWLFGYIDKNMYGIDWRIIVAGVIAFEILKWIPFIGWLLAFLVSIAGFGAILRMARRQLRRE